jgi:hypothetical protein
MKDFYRVFDRMAAKYALYGNLDNFWKEEVMGKCKGKPKGPKGK